MAFSVSVASVTLVILAKSDEHLDRLGNLFMPANHTYIRQFSASLALLAGLAFGLAAFFCASYSTTHSLDHPSGQDFTDQPSK